MGDSANFKSSRKGQKARRYFLIACLVYSSYRFTLAAILAYIPMPRLSSLAKQPVFGETFRTKDWYLFMQERVPVAPVQYGLLHVVPSLVWIVLFPIQYSQRIRQRYPAYHKAAGYVNLSLITLLAASGLSFIPSKLSHSAESIWHIHTLRIPIRNTLHVALRDRSNDDLAPVTNSSTSYAIPSAERGTLLLAWPTFSMSAIFLAIGALICAVQTVRHARARRFEQHRRWAMALGVWCYSVPMHRVIMWWTHCVSLWVATWPKDVQNAIGIPTTLEGMVEGERSLFAFCQALSNIPVAIGLWNLHRTGRVMG